MSPLDKDALLALQEQLTWSLQRLNSFGFWETVRELKGRTKAFELLNQLKGERPDHDFRCISKPEADKYLEGVKAYRGYVSAAEVPSLAKEWGE